MNLKTKPNENYVMIKKVQDYLNDVLSQIRTNKGVVNLESMRANMAYQLVIGEWQLRSAL